MCHIDPMRAYNIVAFMLFIVSGPFVVFFGLQIKLTSLDIFIMHLIANMKAVVF